MDPEIDAGRSMAEDRRDHRITVRMRDGSLTFFTTRTPQWWRPGQRVHVIGGKNVATE